ncbi:hypothetical protein EZV73_20880 [Acidaminobacter sp. JC074]|uniref:type II secretion system protein n=1 Tax=Acidaminobacter sp. JC074 TaxID=2530199 RepID=UPI001F0F280F|nr:hypothetical protein [Acidaminobacter sp. JC074]MCH4890047.1 hypothetical protein [Acidaminobacter sp. JC074]
MNKKGFTLIEIIFSIAFISVVSVVMLSLLATSFEVENETDLMDMAILKLSNEIEQVKALDHIEEQVIEKYYSDFWQETSKDEAAYKLTLKIQEDTNYEQGLYDIIVDIKENKEGQVLVATRAKHYWNRK